MSLVRETLSDNADYQQINETLPKPVLTGAEKVAKLAAKLFVLVGAIIVGGLLGAALSTLMTPFIGVPLGTGVCFLIAIELMGSIDAYFNTRVTERLEVGA